MDALSCCIVTKACNHTACARCYTKLQHEKSNGRRYKTTRRIGVRFWTPDSCFYCHTSIFREHARLRDCFDHGVNHAMFTSIMQWQVQMAAPLSVEMIGHGNFHHDPEQWAHSVSCVETMIKTYSSCFNGRMSDYEVRPSDNQRR